MSNEIVAAEHSASVRLGVIGAAGLFRVAICPTRKAKKRLR